MAGNCTAAPVIGPRFVAEHGGRADVLARLARVPRRAGGRGLWLRGPRRSGKTSLLYQAAARAARKEPVFHIYVDWRGLRDSRVLTQLVGAVRRSARRAAESGGFAPDLPLAYLREADGVRALIDRVLSRTREAGGEVVFAFDEVAAFAGSGPTMYGELLELVDMLRCAEGVGLVVSDKPGVATLHDHLSELRPGLLDGMEIADIHAFTPAEIARFLDAYDIAEALRDGFRREAGGHPYLLQLLGFCVANHTADDRACHDEAFDRGLRNVLLDHLGAGASLQDLRLGETAGVRSWLRQRCRDGAAAPDDAAVRERLAWWADRGWFVERAGDGFALRPGIVASWIARYGFGRPDETAAGAIR